MFLHLSFQNINITVNINQITHIEARELTEKEIEKAMDHTCPCLDVDHKRPVIHLQNGSHFVCDQSYEYIIETLGQQRLLINQNYCLPRSTFIDEIDDPLREKTPVKKFKPKIVPHRTDAE
jgi:hypothetical protein